MSLNRGRLKPWGEPPHTHHCLDSLRGSLISLPKPRAGDSQGPQSTLSRVGMDCTVGPGTFKLVVAGPDFCRAIVGLKSVDVHTL